MSELRNLKPGNHRLLIRKVIVTGPRVTIAHVPIDIAGKELLRTFDFRSKGLCVYQGKVLGRFIEETNLDTLRQLEGHVIVGKVGPAKNPAYVNLIEIVEAYSREQSHILIVNSQSNERKIDASVIMYEEERAR